MKFQKQIEDLSKYVNEYYVCNLQDGDQLSKLIQKITGLLYYLETERSATHNLYENAVFNLVKDGSSVARAVNEANVLYPEMYQLRRIMDGGYRIVDAIRTNISYLKSEKKSVQ
jgi:hypothetical protein|tara:strand:+ start:2102 stop:2443 length:342 start_codon:yes stop_codon:yes gene_type:complete